LFAAGLLVLFARKKNRNNGSKGQQSAFAEPMMAPFLCFDYVEQRFSVQEKDTVASLPSGVVIKTSAMALHSEPNPLTILPLNSE